MFPFQGEILWILILIKSDYNLPYLMYLLKKCTFVPFRIVIIVTIYDSVWNLNFTSWILSRCLYFKFFNLSRNHLFQFWTFHDTIMPRWFALVMSMAWLLPERFPLSENISFGLQTQKDSSFSHAGKKTKHPEIRFYLNISLTQKNDTTWIQWVNQQWEKRHFH